MVYLDLLKGDCLQVMKDLSSNTIDCFICDLPYGCLAGGDAVGKSVERQRASNLTGCSWDIKINLEEFWIQVKRLAKNEHTPVLMFCTTKFGNELINSNPKWFRYDLVWDKQRGVSFLSANKMPMRSFEMIYVFSKAGAYYNRIDEKGEFKAWTEKSRDDKSKIKVYDSGMPNGWKATANDGTTRCVKSIIQIKNNSGKGKHPTEKPIELYKWLIKRYCPPGGTVLDPTAGSFNSCFASYELNRNSIGIEMDEGFYKKACDKADLL